MQFGCLLSVQTHGFIVQSSQTILSLLADTLLPTSFISSKSTADKLTWWIMATCCEKKLSYAADESQTGRRLHSPALLKKPLMNVRQTRCYCQPCKLRNDFHFYSIDNMSEAFHQNCVLFQLFSCYSAIMLANLSLQTITGSYDAKIRHWKIRNFQDIKFLLFFWFIVGMTWFYSLLTSKKKPEIVETNVQKWICLFPRSNLSPLHSLPFSPWELMADGNYI